MYSTNLLLWKSHVINTEYIATYTLSHILAHMDMDMHSLGHTLFPIMQKFDSGKVDWDLSKFSLLNFSLLMFLL